jgi:hypothetical protein
MLGSLSPDYRLSPGLPAAARRGRPGSSSARREGCTPKCRRPHPTGQASPARPRARERREPSHESDQRGEASCRLYARRSRSHHEEDAGGADFPLWCTTVSDPYAQHRFNLNAGARAARQGRQERAGAQSPLTGGFRSRVPSRDRFGLRARAGRQDHGERMQESRAGGGRDGSGSNLQQRDVLDDANALQPTICPCSVLVPSAAGRVRRFESSDGAGARHYASGARGRARRSCSRCSAILEARATARAAPRL